MNENKTIEELIQGKINEEDSNPSIKANKTKKNLSNGIKAIIYGVLSVGLSSTTTILFKAESKSMSPLYVSYFQAIFFLMFLPLSFVIYQIENVMFKKVKEEEEKTNEEMNFTVEDKFSEIMEKKFYENYYRYYKGFYKNALLLTFLYIVSNSLYYASMATTSPLFCISVHSAIGVLIIAYKLLRKGIPKEKYTLFTVCATVIAFALTIIEFFVKYSLEGDQKIFSIIALILSDILFLFFISYLKTILKKYAFYLNIGEFSGYFGLFSVPFVIVIVVLKAVTKSDFFIFNYSAIFFVYSFFSALADFFLFSFLRFVTRIIFSNIFTIEVCILFIFYKILSLSAKDIFTSPFFYLEIVLLISIIACLKFTFDEAIERKLRTKTKGKQNFQDRQAHYFAKEN